MLQRLLDYIVCRHQQHPAIMSLTEQLNIFCDTYTCIFPLGSRIRYNLGNPLCKGASLDRSSSENERKQSERLHS